MNSTKHGHVEGDSELGDGDDWSEEEKPIFTEGLRRSKRQVSFQMASFSQHTPCTHTDGPPAMQLAACDVLLAAHL